MPARKEVFKATNEITKLMYRMCSKFTVKISMTVTAFEFQLRSRRQNSCRGGSSKTLFSSAVPRQFFANIIEQISVFALAIPSAVFGGCFGKVALFN